jgi:hypothetical protein
MNRMVPASTAEFLHFQPIRGLLLVLGGRVVPVLAIGTL